MTGRRPSKFNSNRPFSIQLPVKFNLTVHQCENAKGCRAMPVRSRQKDESEIPINSKVEHQGTVRLFLPTGTRASVQGIAESGYELERV